MNAAHPVLPEDVMSYLDGEVADAQAREIEAHLAGCDACRQVAADFRAGSTQMREWHVAEPPATLVAPQPRRPALTTRDRWAPWHSRAWTVIAHRPVLAGAAAVLLLVTFLGLQPSPKRAAIGIGAQEAAESKIADPRANAAPMPLRPGVQGMAGSRADAIRQAEPGPRIVRTATLRVVTEDLDGIRPAVDRILQSAGGFIGEITASDRPGTPRSIRGTLRIPSAQFDTALAELRRLGRVTEESQGTEDVTATVVDLDVRLSNARVTERRLSEVLRSRTGNVADVLEVEREIARVRTEIEQLDAQRTQLDRRIDYATLSLEIVEERAAAVNLGPVPIPTRLGHAIADGIESAAMGVLETTLFALRHGPAVVLWTIVLGLPAWWMFRRNAQPQRPR